jgi:hypothetical protein
VTPIVELFKSLEIALVSFLAYVNLDHRLLSVLGFCS